MPLLRKKMGEARENGSLSRLARWRPEGLAQTKLLVSLSMLAGNSGAWVKGPELGRDSLPDLTSQ